MSTKKPTAKQLEARKRFAEMAKSGELAKKRASTTKKKKTKKSNFTIIKDSASVSGGINNLKVVKIYSGTSLIKSFSSKIKSYSELEKTASNWIKKQSGLKKPVTKGLTTLCAKTVGVDGRRKKDGTVKKNHVVKKGGKVVAVKKKATTKKGLKGVSKTDKYLVKFWKDKEVIKETKTKTKAEAEKLKRSYLSSFHITKRVAEKRQSTISKL